ncbi:unnamed protein product [Ilex paraguariensis]|uniref:Uncharacterized protein n=1 Tax=Ilex paraguariensis TaxID=185542 RepID=A0ABC8RRD7_9AQUA
MSGLHFFWSRRKLHRLTRSDSAKLPRGFEERTKGRVVVCRVPQLKILAHDSVSGFLTHYGWGSVIEGLQLGRSLITLPFTAEQGLNARVLGKENVGIEIPRDDSDGSFTRHSVADPVRLIMVEEERKSSKGESKRDECGMW